MLLPNRLKRQARRGRVWIFAFLFHACVGQTLGEPPALTMPDLKESLGPNHLQSFADLVRGDAENQRIAQQFHLSDLPNSPSDQKVAGRDNNGGTSDRKDAGKQRDGKKRLQTLDFQEINQKISGDRVFPDRPSGWKNC